MTTTTTETPAMLAAAMGQIITNAASLMASEVLRTMPVEHASVDAHGITVYVARPADLVVWDDLLSSAQLYAYAVGSRAHVMLSDKLTAVDAHVYVMLDATGDLAERILASDRTRSAVLSIVDGAR